MGRENTVLDIERHKLVATVRGEDAGETVAIVEALILAGIRIVEIDLSSEGARGAIVELVQRKMPDVIIGAGGAISADDAITAVDAGATFLMTPVRVLEVVEICHRAEMAAMIGALTPTECLEAYRAGADMVNLSPAGPAGGPGYIRELLTILPGLPLIASGGITLDILGDYLLAGVAAIASGHALTPREMIEAGDFGAVTAHARRYVDLVARHH